MMSILDKIAEADSLDPKEDIAINVGNFQRLVDIWIVSSTLVNDIYDENHEAASAMVTKLSEILDKFTAEINSNE